MPAKLTQTAGRSPVDAGNPTRRVPAPGTGHAMDGLDYLQAIQSGVIPAPPLVGAMSIRIAASGRGRVVVTCIPDDSMYNPAGGIRGGVVCAVLDAVSGYAVRSMLTPGQGHAPVEIKVNYVDVIHCCAGALTAVGTVTSFGSRVGFTEAVATDACGDVVATASSSAVIFAA